MGIIEIGFSSFTTSRPTLKQVGLFFGTMKITICPPAYAEGYVEEKNIDWLELEKLAASLRPKKQSDLDENKEDILGK